MTVIGGSDGPTEIFLSNMGWLNWFGLIIVVLMLAPNIIWALRHRDEQNKCKNKTMNILEQIGRYVCNSKSVEGVIPDNHGATEHTPN